MFFCYFSVPQISITDGNDETTADAQLINWLRTLNIDTGAIERVIRQIIMITFAHSLSHYN